MAVKIQFRRGSATEWTSANPTLSAGEFGFESDTGQFKIGNGSTAWGSLSYLASGTITGVTAGTGLTGGGTNGTVTLSVDTSIYISPQIVDAKGDLIVGTASDTVGRLAVGTANQRLVADSAQTTGLKWVSDTVNTVIDAKGDLLAGTANDTISKLSVGTDGQLLSANSSTSTGLEWVNSPASKALALSIIFS